MPLLNDVARCHGVKMGEQYVHTCPRRETCARYVERKHGGPRTMTYAYLCSEGDDSYIPAEKGETE